MKTPDMPAQAARLARILPLLACPACRGVLQQRAAEQLQCTGCQASYPVRSGVPVLLPPSMQEPGVGAVDADDPVSRHPYSPAALEIIDAHRDGWVLDLGAGGKLKRWDNVIQIDIFRYPMTDVVGTADCLPFRDNAFHAVVSQAVFEHLQYPEWAAAEIRRILQPGGVAKIDTAFLQPEHGYPHHFYNATEIGLRHWFRDFDIEWSGIEAYQHPQWSLSWFLGVYLDRIGTEHQSVLRSASIGALVDALYRRGAGTALPEDAQLFAALDALPSYAQRILAAGVSIKAINPPKLPCLKGAVAHSAEHEGAQSDTLRQLIQAREEIAQLRVQLDGQREQQIVARDRSRYLAQFYPRSSREVWRRSWPHITWRARTQFAAVALLRFLVGETRWVRLRRRFGNRAGLLPPSPAVRPERCDLSSQVFVTFVMQPRSVAALADSFFSLVRQDYSDWQLMLLLDPEQSVSVRQAITDFARLDSRVRVCQLRSGESLVQVRDRPMGDGAYRLWLPEGSMLAFETVRSLFNLSAQHPGIRSIVADVECQREEGAGFMRCHYRGVDEGSLTDGASVPWFVLLNNMPESASNAAAQRHGHIAEVLFRLPAPLVRLQEL